MKRAVCVRCGTDRRVYAQPCPSCGLAPADDGLLVAWLLSSENLTVAELDSVQDRIRRGEVIHPSRRMLDRARRALGQSFVSDPGLTWQQAAGLAAVGVFITPLVGWVIAAWWRSQRPRAALQAAAISAPLSVVFLLLGIANIFA